MLQPLEDQLNAIMQDLGEKGDYCLVMDVSPPSSSIPNMSNIIYFNTALDITDQVIQILLDKMNPERIPETSTTTDP